MEDLFILEFDQGGKHYELEAQYQPVGYIHRFRVWIEQLELWFERDEEGKYRAMLPPDTPEKEAARLDRDLLAAIAARIEEILA